jgi:hypothetical protein
MSKLKNVDFEFEFTPEEIIMYYVKPGEFLKKKFNDLWTRVSDVEIKWSKDRYAYKFRQIKFGF